MARIACTIVTLALLDLHPSLPRSHVCCNLAALTDIDSPAAVDSAAKALVNVTAIKIIE